jgi:hypothetical protein
MADRYPRRQLFANAAIAASRVGHTHARRGVAEVEART